MWLRAAVLGSIALHALLFLLPTAMRSSPREVAPVELELVTRRPVEPSPVAPRATARPRASSESPPRTSIEPSLRPSVAAAPPAYPEANATDAPAAGTVATPHAPVDLFARAALERVVGGGPSEHSDAPTGAAATKQRVDGWLSEGSARSDVIVGRVDPAYRELARRLDEGFRVPKKLLKPHGWAGAVVSQTRSFFGSEVHSAPTSRIQGAMEARDSQPGMPENWSNTAMEQTTAVQAGINALQWTEAEIDVLVRADGSVEDVTLARSSGSAEFDRNALAEIRRIAERRRYEVPRAAKLTFAARGGYAARIPTSLGFQFGGKTAVEGLNQFETTKSEVVLRAVTPR